ncbi:hypothetical protein LG943_19855 [Streptomonospora sp. S1-112]|uniref:Uncharacterized protein n=1 Tax=Streptomonospora mangrovi TaxID=2883123 RepID=A0A9X3SF47_9ACTN|nr:hypothetical protein [Streptomonospora mangrovi]MDA0566548.1 hypothetical protein [Streptomonospora mangrovi]
MQDLLLVLTGAAISLVTSVVVTWLQARHVRRGEIRIATRDSTRRLTSVFIAEREAAETDGAEPTDALAEAEVMCIAIADRRTRERMRALVRLLREIRLPELQRLSGVQPAIGRRLLCDHALEVLGAHFRSERLPAVPAAVQRMLDVEDEALSIHAGGGRPVAEDTGGAPAIAAKTGPIAAPEAPAAEEAPAAPAPRGRIRRKPRAEDDAATAPAKPARRSKAKAAAEPEDEDDTHSAFWND